MAVTKYDVAGDWVPPLIVNITDDTGIRFGRVSLRWYLAGGGRNADVFAAARLGSARLERQYKKFILILIETTQRNRNSPAAPVENNIFVDGIHGSRIV